MSSGMKTESRTRPRKSPCTIPQRTADIILHLNNIHKLMKIQELVRIYLIDKRHNKSNRF